MQERRASSAFEAEERDEDDLDGDGPELHPWDLDDEDADEDDLVD